MTGSKEHRSSGGGASETGAAGGRSAGRQSLTSGLPAGGGAPLADDVRAPFEHVLLADLTGVRVHTGAESAAAASAMGAHAFTVGNDVHMGAGKRTDDPFGMHLLAHEVAHTQQQAAGGVQVQCKTEGEASGEPLEREADQKADTMAGAASPATAGLLLEFEKRATDAAAGMDAAKHEQVAPIRVEGTSPIGDGISFPNWFFDLQEKLHLTPTWGPECENAQKVLRDYAAWHATTYCGGKPPPSVMTMINYAGRSSLNDAAARSKENKNRGTGHYLGYKGEKNWCTGTTTQGVLDGLAVLGLEPSTPLAKIGEWIQHVQRQSTTGGETMRVGAPDAFTAPLIPGDLVMWIADGSQYGGHAVTVVEDFGGSFTHISGNTGPGVGVAIGEAQRLTTLPTAKSGNQTFNLGQANKSQTQAERHASNAYIKQFDFGGKMLVYSITRYGAMFQELGALADLAPDAPEREALMAKFKLREKKGGPVDAEKL